jgi:magnesium transporter
MAQDVSATSQEDRSDRFLAFRAGQAIAGIRLDEIDGILAGEGNFAWLDLRPGESLLFDRVARQLAFHALALEDAVSANQRTKLEDYGETLFIVAKSVRVWEGLIELGEVHLFIGPNFIVTVDHGQGAHLERVRERVLRSPTRGLAASPGLVVHAILDGIVDDYRPVLEAMQDRFEELESTVLTKAYDRRNIVRLYELKRELLMLWSTLSPLEDVVSALMRLQPQLVTKELKAYYRDVQDHVARMSAASDRLREMVSDALQLSMASSAQRQNEAVQRLAGWGAILALPTVVFSLYGMNFQHMPELEWPWAYPAVLLLTGAGMAWLYRRLKKAGWL